VGEGTNTDVFGPVSGAKISSAAVQVSLLPVGEGTKGVVRS
jgi:hypothetical protein